MQWWKPVLQDSAFCSSHRSPIIFLQRQKFIYVLKLCCALLGVLSCLSGQQQGLGVKGIQEQFWVF